MDRLTSLTVFVQVVDSGGFSAAARRLDMSTTMVSHHVQALEDRLGARLLNRTTRKVHLTEVGKAYYDRCTQILSDLEQADDILNTYPDVKIDLTMGERNIDMIDEGFDVAIRLTPPPDSSLVARRLATWRHVLCCSPGYLEKHGPLRQLPELAGHNCVRHVLYPFGDDWHFADREGVPASVRVAGNLVTNSGETLRRAAMHGVGISLAAGFLVAGDLEAGRLVRLLPDYRAVELAMNAVYPHRHHLSVKVRSFIDLLVRHSAGQQKLIDPYS